MKSFEKSLQQLTRSSIESINQSIKSEMGNFIDDVKKRQIDHEAKTEQRINSLEKQLNDRQNILERKIDNIEVGLSRSRSSSSTASLNRASSFQHRSVNL